MVNRARRFALFQDYWQPKSVGELNESQVKVLKLKGKFVWHHHEVEGELFWVVGGQLLIRLRDYDLHLGEGEFVIIPHGVERQPVAEGEVQVVLLEPKTAANTGDVQSERTASAQWR